MQFNCKLDKIDLTNERVETLIIFLCILSLFILAITVLLRQALGQNKRFWLVIIFKEIIKMKIMN